MHNHEHCCQHEHVKFCQKCKQPYCEDCGKEWYEKCQLNHWWGSYYPYYTVPCTTTTYTFDGNGYTSDDTNLRVCEHT